MSDSGDDDSLICKKLGIHQQTYYMWRHEYGELRMDQAKLLKELEKENSLLKKTVGRMGTG